MKILVIHPHLHFLGGSEVLTKILIEKASTWGHEVTVLSKDFNEELFREVKANYIKIKEYSKEVNITSRINNLLLTLSEVLSKYPGHVPLIMIQEPLYALLIKILKPNTKVGMYVHYPLEEELISTNLPKFLENYRFPNMYNEYYKIVELLMTNSNYTAKALYKLYGLTSNVVYPAIPEDYFQNTFTVKDKEQLIISVGRFVPHKKFDVLIKWFKERIRREVSDAKLLIVGIPDARYKDYYENLKKLVSECENVELIERPLRPKELAKYYGVAKVYVHLRIGEHFGMAPVEAMTQGTIPIVPEASGISEFIINDYNGYAFKNLDECLDLILKVLKMSSERYAEISRNAYRTSLYFTPYRFTRDVINYLKLIT